MGAISGIIAILICPLLVSSTQKIFLPGSNDATGGLASLVRQFGFVLSTFCFAMKSSICFMGSALVSVEAGVPAGCGGAPVSATLGEAIAAVAMRATRM